MPDHDLERRRDHALEQLASAPDRLRELRAMLREVRELLERAVHPADLNTFRLTAAQPIAKDDVGHGSASIALLNPNPVTVFLGLAGGRAAPNSEAISCSPRSLLVLPISAADVELGVDPADPLLAGGDAIAFLFRFKTVQPAFLGGV